MTEREYDSGDRGRARSRSRSPRRREDRRKKDFDDDKRDRDDRNRHRSRSRSRSRRDSPRSRSRSRSKSSHRDKRKDRGREHKHCSRSRSGSRIRHRRRRSRSSSRSSSPSSDSDRHHKKRRKDKHRKRSRDKDKERKERKKAKKEKKKKKTSSTGQWGKYGIINESNMYEKEEEFRTWLVEERMINPEILSKDQTKKEFAKFAEDYNTATLPHEKYYDITFYERRMSLIRTGSTLPPPSDAYDPNADLRAHSSAHKKHPVEKTTYMTTEQLQELRKVQQERHQMGKMKLTGMSIGQSFGVRMDGSEFE